VALDGYHYVASEFSLYLTLESQEIHSFLTSIESINSGPIIDTLQLSSKSKLLAEVPSTSTNQPTNKLQLSITSGKSIPRFTTVPIAKARP
jgi:hypothetical protein